MFERRQARGEAIALAASVAIALLASPARAGSDGATADAPAPAASAAAPAPAPTTAPPPSPPPAPRRESVVLAPPRPPAGGEDATAATSVITADRTPRSGESLPQLLSELPGMAVTRFGGLGASAFLSIRGSTWDQVRIVVDGVPLNLASGAQIDLGSIAVGSIERIEVYRAMTPISVGTSALGGTVAITTRQPRASGAEAEAGTGSFGTRFGSASGSLAGGPARVYAAIHLLDVVGDFPYAWDNGTRNNPADDETRVRQNNEIRQGDAVVRAALALAPTRELQLSLSGLGRRQGVPGFGTHLDPEARLTTLRGIASLTYTGRDDLGPAGRLQLQAYSIVTQQQFWDPPAIISLTPADTRDRTTTFGATARAARAATPWLKLAAIADGRAEKFQPRQRRDGVDVIGDPSSRLFASAGAEADAWWERPRLGV
ncbi:MAG TPA: TonB-dependent receptor plug domain-containing protein, partial [Polyangia bacterium]|nr:TonB-dependent receptor plug domain-containing protein [Polyangia bacterium]